LGVFLIASVNPSSWAVLAGVLVWISTYGYFTAETRTRRVLLGVIAVVLGIMGAGARGDSAVYVAFAGFVAMVLTYEPVARWFKLAILPLALMVIGAFFFFAAGQSAGIASVGVSQGGGAGSAPTGETAGEATDVVVESSSG